MEGKRFAWDEVDNELIVSGLLEDEDEKKRDKKAKSITAETKVYCPHKRLIFKFKESLNFTEQTNFRKHYARKLPRGLSANDTAGGAVDVVLLQDVKDLALYLLDSPVTIEFIRFLHLPAIDRFLRALLLYLQHYLTTWSELGDKRAASAKRAPNPLAGGARVQRAGELRALRLILGREYCDLLAGRQPDARPYHHADAGETTFAQSRGEQDLRMFEGLLQLAHVAAWIALERRSKELLEIEIHRLFRTNDFNTAKRKYAENGEDYELPEDEHWILYGPKMPHKRKILQRSSLPYEVLSSNCDYRILKIGLSSKTSKDPRLEYLENALLAKEEDLPQLGIKLGILGLPRADFDVLLIPQASEDEQVIIEDPPADEDKGADDYETLMPPCGSDLELTVSFPMDKKMGLQESSDESIRNASVKKWIMRETIRSSANHAKAYSIV